MRAAAAAIAGLAAGALLGAGGTAVWLGAVGPPVAFRLALPAPPVVDTLALPGPSLSPELAPPPRESAAPSQPAPPGRDAPRVRLYDAEFADLPGWTDDDHAAAVAAFGRSCAAFGRAPVPEAFARFGTPADWRAACDAVLSAPPAAVRAALEAAFEPWSVEGPADAPGTGLLTGYYEPDLEGARAATAEFRVPVHGRPSDMIVADPEAFAPILRGERLAGRIEGAFLVPYDDRERIMTGSLAGRAPVLLHLRSAADLFFLQVQGSGRVRLQDGGVVRLNYAAQNGWPYTAIGRVLIDRGEIAREDMSMQAIRDWMEANPDEADALMNLNRSYVFFRELEGAKDDEGPPGAQGVALTPMRSLAVDDEAYPYGVPVYVDAVATDASGAAAPLRRLLIAQDTGGAIRGAVRGDLFVGSGDAAGAAAGHQRHELRMYLLLPKGVDPSPEPSAP